MTPIPPALVEGGTNFAAAFRALRESIDSSLDGLDKGTSIYRPIVFFVSDGAHQAREDWNGPLSRLRVQAGVSPRRLWRSGWEMQALSRCKKIATRFAFSAKGSAMHNPAREVMQATINSIVRTADSLAGNIDAPGLHVEAPPDLFTALPAIT